MARKFINMAKRADRAKAAFYGVQGKAAAGAVAFLGSASVMANDSFTPDPNVAALKTKLDGYINYFISWGYEVVGLIVVALFVWGWMHKIRKKAS